MSSREWACEDRVGHTGAVVCSIAPFLGGFAAAVCRRGRAVAFFLGRDPNELFGQLERLLGAGIVRVSEKSVGIAPIFEEAGRRVLWSDPGSSSLPDCCDSDGGTVFQGRVWRRILKIPRGVLLSYADVAIDMGLGRAYARCVAQACAANPLAVIVPCHRVVRHDGSLSGYRWGQEWKRRLLALEGVECSKIRW